MGSRTYQRSCAGPASHYACYDCRVSFKSNASSLVCPHCAKSMINMGTAFRAPRKSDRKGWKKAKAIRDKYGYLNNNLWIRMIDRKKPWHGNTNHSNMLMLGKKKQKKKK